MEQSEIARLLQNNGFYESGNQTYPKSYTEIKSNSLLADQVANRDSASWKKAAVVIAKTEVFNIPVSSYIDGWKKLARYGDQILILEEAKGVFGVYDSKGRCIGRGDAYIRGIFKNGATASDLSPVILYGAPGTGKTYHLQTQIYDTFDPQNRFYTTFHQSYCYENFIEGLKPVLGQAGNAGNGANVQYEIEKGVFVKACERAAVLAGYQDLKDCLNSTSEDRKLKFEEAVTTGKIVLLCIDEINRANVSSVFGDTIPLIEKSKRLGAPNELTSILTYSGENFGVPRNLFIVGAMNTADRSIQLLDSALRRRFKFKEFTPDYNAVMVNGIPEAVDVLKTINSRIRGILDKDHQIGHSYFIGVKDLVGIVTTIRDHIIPLLEEYCYNQTGNIKKILCEEYEDVFYIQDKDCLNAYKAYSDDDEDRDFYMLDPNLISITTEAEAKQYLRKLLPTV